MEVRVQTRGSAAGGPLPAAGTVVYAVLSVVAALTSAGIWLLMVLDEERSIGAATLEMVVKFTNLTIVLVGAVAAWIASDRLPGPARAVAHLTVMVMAVVTAVVNATLLDPALPSGWWGVVDLAQHYLIPVAVVAAWATVGPPVDVLRSRLGWILTVPFVWLVFVLARGVVTGSYPYDFLDAAVNGWLRVAATVVGMVVAMLVAGAGLAEIERRRIRRRSRG